MQVQLCDYNNSCYETASDYYYIEYDWNTFPNLEAEFEITYFDNDDNEIIINVCEGCKNDIESNCEENKKDFWEKRIREHTKTLSNRKSGKNYYIRKPWTLDERNEWIKNWHKKYPNLCKGIDGKCSEMCLNG